MERRTYGLLRANRACRRARTIAPPAPPKKRASPLRGKATLLIIFLNALPQPGRSTKHPGTSRQSQPLAGRGGGSVLLSDLPPRALASKKRRGEFWKPVDECGEEPREVLHQRCVTSQGASLLLPRLPFVKPFRDTRTDGICHGLRDHALNLWVDEQALLG